MTPLSLIPVFIPVRWGGGGVGEFSIKPDCHLPKYQNTTSPPNYLINHQSERQVKYAARIRLVGNSLLLYSFTLFT